MVEGERRISKGEAMGERKSTREKCRSQSHATERRAAREGSPLGRRKEEKEEEEEEEEGAAGHALNSPVPPLNAKP